MIDNPGLPSQVRGVGKRGGTAYLFRLGDDLINFGALHKLLAASVPEMMPVVVTELLVDGAQKTGEDVCCPARQGHEELCQVVTLLSSTEAAVKSAPRVMPVIPQPADGARQECPLHDIIWRTDVGC